MGDVTQVGKDKWRLRVSQGMDPVTRKYRRASKVITATSKRAALKELAYFEDGLQPSATSGSYGTLLTRWLEHQATRRNPSTVRAYRSYAEKHIRPALGAIPLNKLSAEQLDKLYDTLATDHSPRTVRQIHAIIHRSLNQGVAWGWVPYNVAAKADPPRQKPLEIQPPTVEQVRRLVELAEEPLRSFIVMAALTGARRSELCNLKWVDVTGDSLTFRQTKSGRTRTVSLPAGALAATGKPETYVFPHPHSLDGVHQWAPDLVTGAFRRLAKQANIDCRLHDLRHFHATTLLTNGTDVRTVAGRLGHVQASTTLNIYAHYLPAQDREAARLVGELFTPKEQ